MSNSAKIHKTVEPTILNVLLNTGRKWYITKGIEFIDIDGKLHERYEYMWRDGTWHNTCGSANFYDSEAAARLSFDNHLNPIKLESELFEI